MIYFVLHFISLSARHLAKITEGMDSKLKDKVFSKLKESSGGYGKMSASDLADMGSMVKDMSVREMQQMNASAVSINYHLSYQGRSRLEHHRPRHRIILLVIINIVVVIIIVIGRPSPDHYNHHNLIRRRL